MLERITAHFEKHRVPNPRLSIEWLLSDLLGVKRLDLYLNYDRPLSGKELDALRPLVKRRTAHEPLQYITGYADFLNTRIHVDSRVLIPRQETEQLTELLLSDTSGIAGAPCRLLDIGTGSGCIAIAIAKARPEWSVLAVDTSSDALELAKENADENDVSVTYLHGDLFQLENREDLRGTGFDVIISNPPYILPEEMPDLERQVIDYEPGHALFHEDPLSVYRNIAEFAAGSLLPDGRLYLECNASMTAETASLIEPLFGSADLIKDYDEKNRFIRAVKSPS